MKYASDLTFEREMIARGSGRLAWALARDSWLSSDARETMVARGFGRYLKTGDVLLTDDLGVSIGMLNAAFLGLVDRESVVGKLDGAVVIPLGASARLQLGAIVALPVAEGDEKQLCRMAFDVAGAPTKVQAQVVLSAEALRCFDTATQNAISNVLVSAVAAAQDAELFRVLTAGSPTSFSTVGDLFAACSGGAPRKPFLVAGLDVVLALPAGTVRDLQAVGITVLTTPAASNTLIALDATGLLVSEGELLIDTARHANMVIDYGGSPPAASTTSLWQADLGAVRVERLIRFAVRAGAVAYASVGGSPA